MSTTRSQRDVESSTVGLVAGGTTVFAASMLAITASWQILAGIAALFNDEIYLVGVEYTYKLDITAWAWVHLVIGAVSMATAIGIFAGTSWAILVGICLASISALGNFAFLPYYPLWALVVIAFDALVIWALSQRLAHAG